MDFTQVNEALKAWNENSPCQHMRVYVNEVRSLGMNGHEQRCFRIGRATDARFDFEAEMLVIEEVVESTRYEDMSTERQGFRRFIPFAAVTHIEMTTQPERISRKDREAELQAKMKAAHARNGGEDA